MRYLAVLVLSVILSTGFQGLVTLWPTSSAPKTTATNQNPSDEDIEVQYARAHVALAEFDLERAKKWNSMIPNFYPPILVSRLERHLEADQARLSRLLQTSDASADSLIVQMAEIAVRNAETELERAKQVQEAAHTEMGEMNVERAELALKIARLNLQRIERHRTPQTALIHLQWQIDDLRDEINELKLHGWEFSNHPQRLR